MTKRYRPCENHTLHVGLKLKCRTCMDWNLKYSKEQRFKRISNGICVCCNNSTTGGTKMCDIHRKRTTEISLKYRNSQPKEVQRNREKFSHIKSQYGEEAVAIFKDYSGYCQICGERAEGKRAHIHHKDKNHRNGSRNNLIIVCIQCHRLIHCIDQHPNPRLIIKLMLP